MERNTEKIKITYKVKLNTNYRDYFILTNKLFNESLKKYFELLAQNEELIGLTKNECVQQLEKLTVLTRSRKKAGQIPKYYFEQNLPVKFRKAVIAKAIGYAKVYFYNNKKNKQESSSYIKTDAPTVFYKNTYKYKEDGQIAFQLFNGKNWDWYISKLSNWEIIKDEEKLSPKVIIQKDCVMVHIPVVKEVKEIKPQEIRKENNIKVCGVVFTNTDTFAICVGLNDKGELIRCKYISGGNRYKNNVKKLLGKTKRNNGKITLENEYKKYWEKIIRINQYYAHYVSRQIIEFCKENNIKVISITESNDSKLTHISKYKHIKNISTPIELSKKIIECLEYKTKLEKILIIKSYINAYDKCYKCLKPVQQRENDALKIICEDGHKNDYYFNAAMNIGKTCLRKLGKRV